MSKPNTIQAIRWCSSGIMAIAAVVSYGHQRQLLLHWGVEPLASAVLPVTVDLLAIICTLAIHTVGVARAGRRAAFWVLLAAGLASGGANWVAGGSLGSKIANVWSVAAYLLAEWVAAKVKAAPPTVDSKRSAAAKKAAATRKANAAKATRKPRTPKPTAAVTAQTSMPEYVPPPASAVSLNMATA